MAERLGTSVRTVRREAQRLRRLGYFVEARPGSGSAYPVRPGVKVPPLLFTADEITALVAGLHLIRAWLPDGAVASTALAQARSSPAPPTAPPRGRHRPRNRGAPAARRRGRSGNRRRDRRSGGGGAQTSVPLRRPARPTVDPPGRAVPGCSPRPKPLNQYAGRPTMKLHQAGAWRSRVRATSWVWPSVFRLCTGSRWEGRTACDLTP
ncbi:HTH domain-containing protein [Streptomyces sioyaensis]|uniref:helix-turn-helix transcriptional regulator n=1 Tax=Streptomyces sioyaensis TaxID=67364 RepID=UPI0036E0140C